MTILQVKNVSHTYHKQGIFQKSLPYVLKNVSFSIEEGQCFTLIGSSGAGKSTIGKIILGIEKPTSGHVQFLGKDLYNVNRSTAHQLRRDLQVVFQDSYSAVNPRLTAEQIIAEPLENFESSSSKEKRAYIVELLEQVGLSERDLRKYPAEFSGGQLQRINIARALALKPKLLVLDEPISSLDMVNQLKIMELFQKLKNELQLTYVFITHDIKAACLLSDQIAILDEGDLVVQFDSTQQFLKSTHPVAERLRECLLADHPSLRTIRPFKV